MLTPQPTTGDATWFTRDRFGLYLHRGLYTLPARHEWVQNWEEMAPENYQRYFDHFSPDLYDPHAWARAARDAGLRYVVVTTKHHDGFCLWDSRHTDFKATNTPFGKDLIRPLVEAFRAEGIRIGFYYSLIDWHHPDFSIDCLHPQRNHPDALEWNAARDMSKYAAYMREQVRELLTDFGPVDLLFFDFTYPGIEENEIARQSKIRPGSEPIFALGKRRAVRADPGTGPPHPSQQPPGFTSGDVRLPDSGADTAARVGARRWRTGRLGNLPNIQRFLGVPSR